MHDTWRRNNGGHLCTSASGMASLSASSSYAISKRRRTRSSKNLLIVLLWKRHSNIIYKRNEAEHDSYQWGRSPAFVFLHVGATATWSGNFFRWVFKNQCILLWVAVGAVVIIIKCELKPVLVDNKDTQTANRRYFSESWTGYTLGACNGHTLLKLFRYSICIPTVSMMIYIYF